MNKMIGRCPRCGKSPTAGHNCLPEKRTRASLPSDDFIGDSNLNVIMLMGPPASGKSTYARSIVERYPDAQVIGSDGYWPSDEHGKYWFDDSGNRYSWNDVPLPDNMLEESIDWAYRNYKKAIRGRSRIIVYEELFLTEQDRSSGIELALKAGYRVTGVWFLAPVDVCIRRNKERQDRVPASVLVEARATFSPPRLREGFHEIIIGGGADYGSGTGKKLRVTRTNLNSATRKQEVENEG